MVERQDRIFDDYIPADEPIALYRELSEVEPSQNAILGFANRYGRLQGDSAQRIDVGEVPGAIPPVGYVYGEPLEDWVRVIEHMHEAVALWDMVRDGDHDALAEAIEWREGRVVYLGTARYRRWRDAGPLAILAAMGDPPEEQRIWKEAAESVMRFESDPLNQPYIRTGEFIRPAILRVLAVINSFLYDRNGPVLFWDQRANKVKRQDIPSNLEGFVWLQFAQALQHRTEPRRCQVCNRWFDVSSGSSRTDRLTCSNTCRTQAYRKRQGDAVRLKAEGKTASQIAKELGSDVKTVKGWLTPRKQKEN
ncbi:MAG TPA: hypothetical protein DDY78_23035 [Planctomycetales bacterium]|nr:hypothetical protein [Planctomycetales bacterium]